MSNATNLLTCSGGSCTISTTALNTLIDGRVTSATSNLATNADLDAFYLLTNAVFVFLMQLGFMLLEIGSVRASHAKAICTKNFIDFLVAMVTWLFVGYGFAFGGAADADYFAGNDQFFGSNMDIGMWPNWFFQWSFASAAATIVSGAAAERSSFFGYLFSTIIVCMFVYPVIVHWVWSSKAWLSDGSQDDIAFKDYAGCGVVHMTGGISAFNIASALGPRDGRFDADGNVNTLEAHNLVLSAGGAIILVACWFGFNGGSTLAASGGNSQLAARVCAITAVGAAFGGLVAFCICFYKTRLVRLEVLMNGVLAGLVSVTAGPDVLTPGGAIVSGGVGGVIYVCWSELMLSSRIDDPLDATAIHAAAGFWGLLSVGILGFEGDYPSVINKGEFDQLSYQLVGGVSIFAYVFTVTGFFYQVCNSISRTILRVPLDIEIAGDLILYGGSAYPDFQKENTPPDGHICMVSTDVMSSTALWEWNPDVMKESVMVFEDCLRANITRCNGYEMMDEGDSLSVVFHNVFDATKFSLASQEDLMLAPWPSELLTHPKACKEGTIWNGLRIRFALDVGNSSKFLNTATNRLSYKGDCVNHTLSIMHAVKGGGIVVTSTNACQELHQKFSHRLYELGNFCIQDLGTYELAGFDEEEGEKKDQASTVSLIQIMPEALNKRPATQIDYLSMLGLPFCQAPGVAQPDDDESAGPASVVFMFASFRYGNTGKKVDGENGEMVSKLVVKLSGENDGYVSKDSNGVFLLAFSTADESIGFLGSVSSALQDPEYSDMVFSAGIHSGVPSAVNPNKTSGRADYLGPPVNVSARCLAVACDDEKGFRKGNLAIAVTEMTYQTMGEERDTVFQSMGHFSLKGVENEVEVYAYTGAEK